MCHHFTFKGGLGRREGSGGRIERRKERRKERRNKGSKERTTNVG